MTKLGMTSIYPIKVPVCWQGVRAYGDCAISPLIRPGKRVEATKFEMIRVSTTNFFKCLKSWKTQWYTAAFDRWTTRRRFNFRRNSSATRRTPPP